MKLSLKIAMAAAIAGVLVDMLLKQRQESRMSRTRAERFADAAGPQDQIADTNSIGDEAQQRGPQPQDWRGAQNVLES